MGTVASLLNALFPTPCAGCGKVLAVGEKQLCLNCLADLPHTHYSHFGDNPAEQLLGSRIRFRHATSCFFFRQGNVVQHIVHDMKFHHNSDLCLLMGRLMAGELRESGRFDDVDLLVPVPLHWRRRLERGYNQSELLCRGIAQALGREVDSSALVRHRHTQRQSLQASANRQQNVEGAFRLRHPEQLAGRHLLLVDDVLTTGATLASCCDALRTVPDLSLSIATLCIAGS